MPDPLSRPDRDLLGSMLQDLVEGDPGMFAYGEQGIRTGNITDPRMLHNLRVAKGLAGKGQLTRPIARGMTKEILGPVHRAQKASASLLADTRMILEPHDWQTAAKKLGMADMELTRRRSILRAVLKLLKGKGALGIAAALGAMGLGMFGGRDADAS